MTKAEVVSKIASKTGVEKVTTLAIVESFMSEIMSAVSENEAVFFPLDNDNGKLFTFAF